MFPELMLMALDSLRANIFRSLLTMLGIIIGSATLVAVLSLGNALQSQVFNQFVDLGTRRIALLPADPRTVGARDVLGYGLISERDYRALDQMVQQNTTVFHAIVPEMSFQNDVHVGPAVITTEVVGTTKQYQQVQTIHLQSGRFLTDADDKAHARVAVLGSLVAEQLFGKTQSVPELIGRLIDVNGTQLQVIGVLQSIGGPYSSDLRVLIPMSTARLRVAGPADLPGRGMQLTSILLSLQDEHSIEPGKVLVNATLRAERSASKSSGDDFQINEPTQAIDVLNGINGAITAFIALVAGISLVVGGIGIMNIMLVAVTERTREIGIRKALGATDQDVLGQFVLEAAVISIVGGLIGVASAIALVTLISVVAGIAAPIAWIAVALALLFAAVIGISFGYYPARRAAFLKPIEALRYE